MRSHEIVKHNLHFHLQQDIWKKNFFFEKKKTKVKNIHITNIRTNKFLVPGFHKYCRHEITTRYQYKKWSLWLIL